MTDIPERLMPGTPDWDRYYYEHRQRYEFFAHLLIGKTVLDAACGVGYGSQILALAGAKHVTGIDIASEAILQAQKYFCEANVSFQQADVTHLPMSDNHFESVISFETIEHLPNPLVFVQEIRRILKPGGLLIISTPNRDFKGKGNRHNPYHMSEMTFAEFSELIGQFFVIQQAFTQTHSLAYLRHLLLVEHLTKLDKAIRYDVLFKLENGIRRLFKRWVPELPLMPTELTDAIPGDFIIEPIEYGKPNHLTLILQTIKP